MTAAVTCTSTHSSHMYTDEVTLNTECMSSVANLTNDRLTT